MPLALLHHRHCHLSRERRREVERGTIEDGRDLVRYLHHAMKLGGTGLALGLTLEEGDDTITTKIVLLQDIDKEVEIGHQEGAGMVGGAEVEGVTLAAEIVGINIDNVARVPSLTVIVIIAAVRGGGRGGV